MSFTARQQRFYRGLVDDAWRTDARRNAAPVDSAAAREAWYREELRAAIGVSSTTRANNTGDYDTACLHFAMIAGNDDAIGYFSAAVERRYRHWIARRMRDLSRLERRPVDWPYIVAMWHHMNLPLDIETAPADSLRTVFQALDTHVRRLRR